MKAELTLKKYTLTVFFILIFKRGIYNMKKRKFALILIILVFCLIFASCQGQENNLVTDNTDNLSGSDIEGENPTEEVDSRTSISDDLPAKDYGGYEFRVYTNEQTDYGNFAQKFAPDSEIGEVVNDAVYRRNKTIEDRFNVSIKTISTGTDQQQHTNKIKTALLAGEDAFDVAFVHCIWGPNLTLEGFAYNLLEVPAFNFDKPWWQKQTNEELTMGNKMFLGSNSIFYAGLASTKVIYFNREKIADYGLEMPYQTVFDGKWTLDKLTSMTKDCYEDLNGNGQKDREDFYGYVSFSIHNGFLTAFDIPILEKSNDSIEVVVNNEKTVNFVEKIYDWYYNSTGVLVDADYSSEWDQQMFANGQALFAFGRLKDAVNRYVASNVEYGIVPMPKYDEAQANYRAFSVDEFFMLPHTANGEALERSGIILEALSAEGYKQIIPAYYEIALKNKYLQDEESVKVLDLINDCRTISFAYVYDNWEGFGHMCGQLFGTNPTREFTSFYEKRMASSDKRIATIVKGFTE